ncbi:MAG: response regulator [Patescibacteria group bacterium]
MKIYNILLVDDDDDVRKILKRFLDMEGKFAVAEAEDGIEALKILKKKSTDIVVADHSMPNLSGIEMFEEVAEKYPEIIRILLSGVAGANTEILTEAINKGTIDCFFEKPLNLECLINRLDKEIELAERRKMNPKMSREIEE